VDNAIFFRNGNDSHFRPILQNQTLFNPSSYNQNLTWAIADNAVWKFDPLASTFTKEHQLQWPIFSKNRIEISEKRLLITAVNMTSAQIFAYSISGPRNLSLVFKFSFALYQS
jgi:hypothetical protein